MLASRVEGALRAAGHEVEVRGALPGAGASDAAAGADQSGGDAGAGGFDLVVCDLEAVDPAAVAEMAQPSLGFYSHVEVELRERAVAAGIDLVVPRSRMSRELPKLVERLLGD